MPPLLKTRDLEAGASKVKSLLPFLPISPTNGKMQPFLLSIPVFLVISSYVCIQGFRFVPLSSSMSSLTLSASGVSMSIYDGTTEPRSFHTISELSILLDTVTLREGKEKTNGQLAEYTRREREELGVDKDSRSSNDEDNEKMKVVMPFAEMSKFNGDWEVWLNKFRRTIGSYLPFFFFSSSSPSPRCLYFISFPISLYDDIALRASEPYIRDPAANAMVFAALINLMIADSQWKFCRHVVDYVGIIPTTYCFPEEIDSTTTSIEIDITCIATHIFRKTLALDIDNMKGLEYVSAKENVGEWCPRGVLGKDLGYRATDMLLAILRLALRHALDMRCNASSSLPIYISIVHGKYSEEMQLFVHAGIDVGEGYLNRCKDAVAEDVRSLLPFSFVNDGNMVEVNRGDIYIDGVELT